MKVIITIDAKDDLDVINNISEIREIVRRELVNMKEGKLLDSSMEKKTETKHYTISIHK